MTKKGRGSFVGGVVIYVLVGQGRRREVCGNGWMKTCRVDKTDIVAWKERIIPPR